MNFNDDDDLENGGPKGGDTSTGAAGNDTVTGAGDDTATGAAGTDTAAGAAGNDTVAGAADPAAAAAAAKPGKATTKPAAPAAPAKRKSPLEKALDAALAKGDAAEIRLRATRRTMGDARDIGVVYRTNEATPRRVADVKANAWLRAQILAGVIEIQG